jgi:hypothetical protein
MKAKLFLLLSLLLFLQTCEPCLASDKWSRETKDYYATLLCVSLADYKTTMDIVEKRWDYSKNPVYPRQIGESNPLLTRHPSEGEVNRMFISTLIVITLATELLPEKYRSPFLNFCVTTDALAVRNNLRVRGGFNLEF